MPNLITLEEIAAGLVAPQYNTFAPSKPSKRKKSVDEYVKEKSYNVPIIKQYAGYLAHRANLDGEVGLEIECEGMNLFKSPIRYWQTHVDHSLRPVQGHDPIEYVLREPLPRTEVPKALTYLISQLKNCGSTLNQSHRTSVHVHVNVQPLTMKQIYQFIGLYLIFEETLIEFAGPERVGNLFCLSAKQAEYFVSILESCAEREDFRNFFNEEYRYSSCNLASVGKLGSLEFRALRGTVDQKLIQAWVDTLLLIKDKALEYDNPRAIVEDFMNSRAEAFLHKIFYERPDLREMIFGDCPQSVTKSMWDGLRLFRDAAYACEWEPQRKKYNLAKLFNKDQKKEVSPQPNQDGWQISFTETPSVEPGYESTQSWLHSISIIATIAPNVMACRHVDNSLWIVNFSNEVLDSVPVGNETWYFRPREAYSCDGNLKFTGMKRNIDE